MATVASAARAHLGAILGARVPGRNLGLARIGIALALLLTLIEYLPRLYRAAEPSLLRMPRFEWMPEPSLELIHILVAAWTLGAVGLLVGWWARAAGALVVASLAFVLALDAQLYSNHLYLLLCLSLLLTVAESDAAYSVTARRSGAGDRLVSVWPVTLLKCQLSIVYLFAAVSKLNGTFLSGSVLLADLRGGVLPIPEAVRIFEVLAPLAWLSVLAELYLAYALWSAWRRGKAVWLGVAFHAALMLTMAETLGIAAFSVAMLALYPLFFRTPSELLSALREGPLRRRAPAVQAIDRSVLEDPRYTGDVGVIDQANASRLHHRGPTRSG